MRILGIDYGRAKIGLALAMNRLAEPYRVIKYKHQKEALSEIQKVIQLEEVEHVVVGVSEGEMGQESQNFANLLKKKLKVPVDTFDETLSTQDAQLLSRAANLKIKKRRYLEDAYAAAVILQNYLDR